MSSCWSVASVNQVWHDANTLQFYKRLQKWKQTCRLFDSSAYGKAVAEIHVQYPVIWFKSVHEYKDIFGLQTEKLKEYSVWVYKI